MTMTDPIADMLTRIRNANVAFHDDVVMPSSKLKVALAKILEQRGLHRRLRASRTTPSRPGRKLQIKMKYTPDRQRTISGIRRVSKPGLRVYTQGRPASRGCSAAWASPILSTNQGLMTDREARQRQRRRRSPVPGLVAERMSRVGKQPITIPSGVEVTIDGVDVVGEGPEGRRSSTSRPRRSR